MEGLPQLPNLMVFKHKINIDIGGEHFPALANFVREK